MTEKRQKQDDGCEHPLSAIERRSDPDWKGREEKTIWYYGFCTECGADVEVEYQFERTVKR